MPEGAHCQNNVKNLKKKETILKGIKQQLVNRGTHVRIASAVTSATTESRKHGMMPP